MPTAVATVSIEIETIGGWKPVRPLGVTVNRMLHKDAMQLCGLNARTSRNRWSDDLKTLCIAERIKLSGEQVLLLWKLNIYKQMGGSRSQFLEEFGDEDGSINQWKLDRYLIHEFHVSIAGMERRLREEGFLPHYAAAS